MLKIDKELFQWEKGRVVEVSDEKITTVEFYNKKSKYSDEVIVENGQVQIPNKLLKESLPITALGCSEQNNERRVVCRKVFRILESPRPEFYIDDDNPDTPEDIPDIPGIDVIYDGGVIV